jgi:hypothetical protein
MVALSVGLRAGGILSLGYAPVVSPILSLSRQDLIEISNNGKH